MFEMCSWKIVCNAIEFCRCGIKKKTHVFVYLIGFLPASPKAKAGLGVQSLRPSVRPSVCPSVPKSCHRNSSETTDPIIMKLGM